MLRAKYPVTDAALPLDNGAVYPVRRGQHWHADAPVVLQHPDMFSDDPRYGLAFSTPPPELNEPPVEAATANPGEVRRGPGRPRRIQ